MKVRIRTGNLDVEVEGDTVEACAAKAIEQSPAGTGLAQIMRMNVWDEKHQRYKRTLYALTELYIPLDKWEEPMVELHAIYCGCERCAMRASA